MKISKGKSKRERERENPSQMAIPPPRMSNEVAWD
jgi:hypothetical protein